MLSELGSQHKKNKRQGKCKGNRKPSLLLQILTRLAQKV